MKLFKTNNGVPKRFESISTKVLKNETPERDHEKTQPKVKKGISSRKEKHLLKKKASSSVKESRPGWEALRREGEKRALPRQERVLITIDEARTLWRSKVNAWFRFSARAQEELLQKEGGGAGCRVQRREMVRVSLRTPGTTQRRVVDLPAGSEVAAIRQVVAHELGSPYERLKLIKDGKTLEDERNSKPSTVKFVDGDSLLAMVVPKPPPSHISSRDGEIEDEDEDLKFRLPESATPLQRKLASFLRAKLKVPDVALIVLFSISLRGWLLTILWFALLPLARRWDLGPVYIITTILLVIFLNLGKRQPGEASAYSIFNEDFRELPGTLNAERLDRDIRAGQF